MPKKWRVFTIAPEKAGRLILASLPLKIYKPERRSGMDFKLHSDYKPTGDQPEAIKALTESFENGCRAQTLLGVTGSGKTFTMANVIANLNRPAIILSHNKTLAAQLCSEFREFFPENAVEYFVSYYDYYQPEAYIPTTDTYIEKDSAVNDEIDKLRHSATAALSERRDVIIVASVSCIYTLGDPVEYKNMTVSATRGLEISRNEFIANNVGVAVLGDRMDHICLRWYFLAYAFIHIYGRRSHPHFDLPL